jgi:hypothetical protein
MFPSIQFDLCAVSQGDVATALGNRPSPASLHFRAFLLVPRSGRDLLSWDSSRFRSPPRHRCRLIGSEPGLPLHRRAPRRPLPLRCRHLCFGLDDSTSSSRSDPVVSHHLAGFRRRSLGHPSCRPRLSMSPGVAGLLHPAADPGVHRVFACGVLAMWSTPRRMSPAAAVPCHHGLFAFWALVLARHGRIMSRPLPA